MTLEELASTLRVCADNDADRLAAIDRLISAATPCDGFDEIERELPAKARYIGPGPWLDAIREANALDGVQDES
jgi:hypothetical protein